MKRKKIYKVGLSLLVAALFIFSAAGSMAKTIDTEKGEAGVDNELTRESRTTERRLVPDAQSLAPPNMVTISGLYAGDYELTYGASNLIPSGTYPLTIELLNDGGGPALVKAFAEVYKKCCGEEVLMYDTSFEDNFDIYNNWMQIDRDCGMDPDGNVGFFDTWTHTDARAYCDDHSFKNTMYDIYKGNQDDYLMCTKSFDVRAQYGTKVNFKIWVEGQQESVYALSGYDIYSLFDYLDFEVGDHMGNWVNPYNVNSLTDHPDQATFLGADLSFLEGGYNFADTTLPIHTYSPWTDYCPKAVDLGGGWWDVTFDVPNWYLELVLGLDLSDIMFRFSWHSDPQFQFEGAYVDCFEVWSLEDCEEKIFQTHSQGPFEVGPCDPQIPEGKPFTFPLQWDAEFIDECGRKETCYDIVVWIEVLDPMHWTPHDWTYPDWWILEGNDPADYPGPQDYLVCVGDYFDVCVENLEVETSFGGRPVPPEGIMYEGEDAHIMADIHVEGTLPGTNIVIDAYAEEKKWEEIFFTDGENMMPWSDVYGFVHNTDNFAWSGSKSIGFFDEVENEYPNDGFSYIIGPRVDFSEYEEVVLDYYTYFATETGYDYAIPCLLDPYSNYVLGYGYISANNNFLTGWSDEDWYGPMQPRSWYMSVDLMAQYNHYVAAGFLRDPTNTVMNEVQVGFYFSSDAPFYGDSRDNHNSNQPIGWSGVCLDDISIRGLKIGEKVWEDSIMIPGPCEPSETCAVQFEWEDVPFSNYRITVEDVTEGSCNNYDCGEQSQQILVITDLERAHYKEVDSVDLTGTTGGPWGQCTSDYDNYLSSNPDSAFYAANAVTTATLCPNGKPCLDISEYFGGGGTFPVSYLYEDFSGGCPPAGWVEDEAGEWSASATNVAGGPSGAPEAFAYWLSINGNDITYLESLPVDTQNAVAGTLTLDFYFALDWWDGFPGHDTYLLIRAEPGDPWSDITPWTNPTDTDFQAHYTLPIAAYQGSATQIRFETTVDDIDYDGIYIDDVHIFGDEMLTSTPPASILMDFEAWWDLEALYGDYVEVQVANCVFEDGSCCGDDGYCCPDEITEWTTIAIFSGASELIDPVNDGWIPVSLDLMNGFGMGNPATEHICVRFVLHGGPIGARGFLVDDLSLTEPSIPQTFFGPDTMDNMNNWCFDVLHYGQYWNYEDVDCCGTDGGWFNNVPALPVNDALVWTTEIMDAYEAYLTVLLEYSFGGTTMAYLEISDDGGSNWFILAEYTGSSLGCIMDDFNLNYWVGKPVQVRVRVVGGDSPGGGFINICDLAITGKEDNTAPTTSIEMSGTLKESGWYASAVKITINAEDTGSGVKEIHVVVDGDETVYPGDSVTITISEDGYHDVSYWAVDNVGNVGETRTVPTFKIDAGAKPTVEITEPQPGIYLFGKKLLSSDKVFIIGSFDFAANAEDEDSGIYKVSFYLDDELLGEKTDGDGSSYSFYVNNRHMGAGTLKVVAEDFAQNVAEDTLDIKYYKFF